jgi:hypothetical protein
MKSAIFMKVKPAMCRQSRKKSSLIAFVSPHSWKCSAVSSYDRVNMRAEAFWRASNPFPSGWSQLFASVGSLCGHWLTTKVTRKATKRQRNKSGSTVLERNELHWVYSFKSTSRIFLANLLVFSASSWLRMHPIRYRNESQNRHLGGLYQSHDSCQHMEDLPEMIYHSYHEDRSVSHRRPPLVSGERAIWTLLAPNSHEFELLYYAHGLFLRERSRHTPGCATSFHTLRWSKPKIVPQRA